jgi:hypothetical protein
MIGAFNGPVGNLLIWALGGILVGFLVFIAAPVFAAPLFPREQRTVLGRYYARMGAFMLRRPMFVRRKHGGYSLYSGDFNSEYGTEQVDVGGQQYDVEDPYRYVLRWANRKTGVFYEKLNGIYTPVVADCAERYYEVTKGDKDLGSVQFETEEGIVSKETIAPYVTIDRDDHRLVDAAGVEHSSPGSASPTAVKTVVEYTKRALAGYKNANYQDVMMVLLAFGLGFGAIYMARTTGAAGGGGVSVPIMLGWFA